MIMKRLSMREQKILLLVGGLVFIYTNYNFVFKPLTEKKQELTQQVDVAQKRLEKYLRMMRKEETMDQEYESYLTAFKQQGSEQQVMSSILAQIDTLASQMNVRVMEVKPKRMKDAAIYNQFTVPLIVEGSWQALMQFLYTIEEPAYSFLIDELFIERGSSQESLMKCHVTISRLLIPEG